MASYCASKAAIDMLSKTIAVEEGPKVKGCHQVVVVDFVYVFFLVQGIRSNTVWPGAIATPLLVNNPGASVDCKRLVEMCFFWEERGPI